MMDEAHQSAEWDRMASLMCLVANMVRGKGKRPLKLHEFHPYEKPPRGQTGAAIDSYFRAVRAQRKAR